MSNRVMAKEFRGEGYGNISCQVSKGGTKNWILEMKINKENNFPNSLLSCQKGPKFDYLKSIFNVMKPKWKNV